MHDIITLVQEHIADIEIHEQCYEISNMYISNTKKTLPRRLELSRTKQYTIHNFHWIAITIAMPTTARSRSRSRSRSQSVIPAQHVHPLAFQPQPQGVRLANTWISLHREVWALRITIRILNLILAALWNLPVRYSSTVASRIGASTWTRDRSINRD